MAKTSTAKISKPKLPKAVPAPKAPKIAARWKALVIVESPTKAKTIRKFLPPEYHVEACVGHIRDLPASAKEIPEKYKKEKWASLGIDVEHDFSPLYIIPAGKLKVIKHLKDCMDQAEELILATDEDREGESISHHLVEVLKPKIPTKRMVFHEITKGAIREALENFREIDYKLVQAQESRRILDRLFGYSLSPLLWTKIAYGLSAGRVQSVATRLIVEKEEHRLRFKQGIYCGLLAGLNSPKGELEGKLTKMGEKRIATGKDFDELTGKIQEGKEVYLLLKKEADELSADLKTKTWKVSEVTEKPLTRRSSPPFITSTLQQEANRKLGLSSRDAMRVAQGLYEKGFITYMRTDSVNLSQEAITGARTQVETLYGKDYLSDGPRQFTSKIKGAQEAHEAIRPAGPICPTPQSTGLSGIELALYDLIWKRTVATQMADAKQLSVSITIEVGNNEFQSTGTRIVFPGFLRAYVEGSDDVDAALEEREVILPDVKAGDILKLADLKVTEHETKPPARYTEASIIQTLEKEGIGRPSTYASIISTIIDRGYVRRMGNALVPTFTAFAVVKLLKKHFSGLIDLQFTAGMEETLDEIAGGTKPYLQFLKEFYSDKTHGLKAQIASQEKKIDPDDSRMISLENFPDVEFRIGKFGPYFLSRNKKDNTEIRASIPEDIAPADLKSETIDQLIQQKKDGPPNLGVDPKTGMKVYLMNGRYGPYLQLGESEDADVKPKAKVKKKKGEVAPPPAPEVPKVKRSVLPKGVNPQALTFEAALGYLSLPRTLGVDEGGLTYKAGLGRFGPYIVKSGPGLEKPEYRSLKVPDDVLSVDFSRAKEIFLEERVRGKGRGKREALRVVGEHPIEKKPIEIFNGPYGIYCKCGKINASIPKEIKPEDLTLEKAIELIEARRR
ncbi:MAG: topoisomerase bacterial [Bacteriovoracaceae bacterium]|nr:topoisomerase bacterial [Bacteriovoracaceae bacterium]